MTAEHDHEWLDVTTLQDPTPRWTCVVPGCTLHRIESDGPPEPAAGPAVQLGEFFDAQPGQQVDVVHRGVVVARLIATTRGRFRLG